MYTKEIKTIAESLKSVHNSRLRKYAEEIQQAINATAFLPLTAKLKERIWYILNGVSDIMMCRKCCSVPVEWNFSMGKFRMYCSTKCSNSASEKKEKGKQTCVIRFGVDNIFKTDSFKEHVKEHNLLKFGVEHHFSAIEIKEKIKYTNLKNHGVEYPAQNKQIQKKMENICFERHGVKNPLQNPEIYAKGMETRMIRYDSYSFLMSKKFKNDCSELYGVDFYTQKHMGNQLPKLLDKYWLYEQHVNQQKSVKEIASDLNVSESTVASYMRNHEIKLRKYKNSHKAVMWLDFMANRDSIFIQHAKSGGEYHIPNTPYHADGYCELTNTIYEFYGDYWHGNPSVFGGGLIDRYHKTLRREARIINMGYNIISVWETDFESVINNNMKKARNENGI